MQNSPHQPLTAYQSAFGLIMLVAVATAAVYLLMANQSVTASGVVVFDSSQLFGVVTSLIVMVAFFTLAGLKLLPKVFSYLLHALGYVFSLQGIGLVFVLLVFGYIMLPH